MTDDHLTIEIGIAHNDGQALTLAVTNVAWMQLNTWLQTGEERTFRLYGVGPNMGAVAVLTRDAVLYLLSVQ